MTMEELQAENLRLSEENTALKNENENYSKKVTDLESEVKTVRDWNQQIFLKLKAQETPGAEEPEENEAPSCVDFAKTLTI